PPRLAVPAGTLHGPARVRASPAVPAAGTSTARDCTDLPHLRRASGTERLGVPRLRPALPETVPGATWLRRIQLLSRRCPVPASTAARAAPREGGGRHGVDWPEFTRTS